MPYCHRWPKPVKKRQCEEVAPVDSVCDPPNEDEAPKKKPSPTSSEKSVPPPPPTPSEKSVTPPKSSPAEPLSEPMSDDDVPAPSSKLDAVPCTVVAAPYEQLHSILCAYKVKKVVPVSSGLPFDLCVSLCNCARRRVWSLRIGHSKGVSSCTKQSCQP